MCACISVANTIKVHWYIKILKMYLFWHVNICHSKLSPLYIFHWNYILLFKWPTTKPHSSMSCHEHKIMAGHLSSPSASLSFIHQNKSEHYFVIVSVPMFFLMYQLCNLGELQTHCFLEPSSPPRHTFPTRTRCFFHRTKS